MRQSRVFRFDRRTSAALSMWLKLNRASASLGHVTTEHLRAAGLTQAQFAVLETLAFHGPLTMGDLTRKQLASGGNTTVVVNNLARQGLVDRVRKEKDKRIISIVLTANGKKIVRRIIPAYASLVSRMASVITPSEQRTLASLARKLGTRVRRSDPYLKTRGKPPRKR